MSHEERSAPADRGMSRWVQAMRARTAGELSGDEGIAMLLSLFLIFVVASLSIAVAGIVYNQVQPTQYQRKNLADVNAAQAGLQLSLDQIRAASTTTNGTVVGRIQNLRCTGGSGATFSSAIPSKNGQTLMTASGATFAGYVNADPNHTTAGATASGGTLKYQTSLAYYLSDPSGKSLDWLAANALSCPLSKTPQYAYVQSHGLVNGQSSISGNRTEHATYLFATSNANVAGGRLVSIQGSNMCLDAGSTSPGVGGTVSVQTCSVNASIQQTWSYRSDLTLQYAGNTALNLCIDALAVGSPVLLKTCATTNGAAFPYASGAQEQEFALDSSHKFFPVDSSGNAIGNTCLAQPSGATVLQLTTDCSNYYSWTPDPSVGAGRAGNDTGKPAAPTNELVNFAKFAFCLDDTEADTRQSTAFLIIYQCKQSPNDSNCWNQQFYWTAAGSVGYGTLTTKYFGNSCGSGVAGTNNQSYCAQPKVGDSPYVGLMACDPNAGSGDGTLWRPTGNVPGDYTHSYEMINKSTNQCLSVAYASTKQFTNAGGSQETQVNPVILETCSGTTIQKWNAPANTPPGGLGNFNGDTGAANNVPAATPASG